LHICAEVAFSVQVSEGDAMKDDERTKDQLVYELTELRSQNAALKKSITGSVSAELAAEEARRYAESIVEAVREPLLVLDADLKIVSANRNFYRTFKVTPGETIGSFIYDLGNSQWDIPKLRELLEEVLPEKQAFDDFEVDYNFEDIGHKTMLLNARQIHRKDIGAKIILLAIEDITEHKRLENLLKESERRYKRVFDTASDGIVFFEQHEGKITHANPATKKMLGYTQKEIIGSKLQGIGITLDMGDFQMTLQNLNKSGILNYRNVKAEAKSGQHIDTEIYLVDRAELVQCNIRDITEHKRAKEALRESEERFRNYIERAPDGVFIVDDTGQYLECNQAATRMIGYSEEEIKKMFIRDLLAEESLEEGVAHFNKLMETGTAESDLWHKHKNGSKRCLTVNAIKLSETQVLGFFKDITDRKQAEEELRLSEERFRKVFDNHTAVKLLIDPDIGNIIEANKAAVKYYGWPRERLLQMKISEINTLTPEELKKELEKAHTRKQTYFEFHHRLADGSIRDVEVFSSNIEEEGKSLIHSIIHDVTDRKLAEQKLAHYRLHLEKMILERTEGLQKEIMEHRHTEQALRISKESAEMANRAKSIFLSGMSHEFRTPLTAIIGFSDVLNKQYFGPLNDKQKEFVWTIVDSGKHLLALIGDILDLAKIEAGKEDLNCTPISIPELLINCISMIKEMTRSQGIEVCLDNEKSLDDIKLIADIRRLKQVMYNLLSNAAKFTPTGGRIIIRVKEVPYAEPALKKCCEFVEVSVTDTGIGLNQGDLGKVFEEFHQVNANTRDKKPGTGLGLALAQRIVRMHGGRIWAESAGLGQGSTFIFRIPCVPPKVDDNDKEETHIV
jgi:PAS domain S-box-containing protein